MKGFVKKLQQLLYSFFPYVVFLLLRNKKLKEELYVWGKILRIKESNSLFLFSWLFFQLREYRSVFYYRIGGLSRLFRWYAPGQYALFFGCANIGNGLVLHHGYSTILHMERCGDNCQIWQNVTVGVAHNGGPRPVIGNNVQICTGAIVLGGIHIGDNVIIGAGSIVVKDVPDNVVVVGNPAHILKER